ncbi:MAG: hypothetical protein QNJ54_25320 [Prochloraceae cyanobacterium]|nr:hypothetical protein [Prochloraceae cyanobacterium]
MRFFVELSNKIIWVVVSALLIGSGYVAFLNFWLKPKPLQVATKPIPTSTKPITPSTTAPTLPNSQPQPSSSVQQTTSAQNINENPDSKSNLIPALVRAEEIELITPKKMVKGAILKIYEDDTPERSLATKVFKTNELKLLDSNKIQQLSAFFSVPENGYYYFKVFGIKSKNVRPSSTYFVFRINGQDNKNSEQAVYLEKGWHEINFQAMYSHQHWSNLSDFVDFKKLAFKWRKEEEKSFNSLEPWRVDE